MRLPASYAGARRAQGRAAVLTAPYAKARATQPQPEGLHRRQRVSVNIGANVDSDSGTSNDELSSDDGPSSQSDSDSDSDTEGAISASVQLAATTGRTLPVLSPAVTRPGVAEARHSKRSHPLRSKRDVERRTCGCKNAATTANAAVDGTVLVKIEDGDDGDDEDQEEEDDEDDEDEDDSSSSSSSSDSDEDEEEEDDDDEKADDDIIVPILPAAAARIRRRALLGRRNGRVRIGPVKVSRKRSSNVVAGDDQTSSSASGGDSFQSSDEGGASSSDDEGGSPPIPSTGVGATAGVKLDISSGKIGVVGTIDFDASTVDVIPRTTPNDGTTASTLSIAGFSVGASPCAIAVSAVFLLAVLAVVGFRHGLRRRRRSAEYVPLAVEISTTVDVDKSNSLFPSRINGTRNFWFKATPASNDEQV
ncbi:hypothetical protein AURDEDRAFT_184729 [Auricularia subglabra TFB-10046 SS5]|nr:hypothetical protein AURDEDRAFT_184729 [Auricularia subglabra TFB-10046 SS5]